MEETMPNPQNEPAGAEVAVPPTPERVRRTIEAHRVNAANDKLVIEVLDDAGAGGACHLYRISGFDSGTNMSDPFRARYGKAADHATVLFQNGPIGEVGVNGVTQEALLAILVDRLSGFQAGPHACAENEAALRHAIAAQSVLHARTRRRVEAGTEGTHRGA